MPWVSGGSAAIVLKDTGDEATRAKVGELLDRLAAAPANGVDRVLDAATLHARGGFPPASFLVALKPGWSTATSLGGAVLTPGRGGAPSCNQEATASPGRPEGWGVWGPCRGPQLQSRGHGFAGAARAMGVWGPCRGPQLQSRGHGFAGAARAMGGLGALSGPPAPM